MESNIGQGFNISLRDVFRDLGTIQDSESSYNLDQLAKLTKEMANMHKFFKELFEHFKNI